MKIILIGFMGSGKSTVAQKVGAQLHLPVIDMDALVFQKTGTRDMHELFAKGGELLLRETEIAVAREIAVRDSYVVSTGGGVVLNKIILDYLQGKVVFLQADFQTIAKRLIGDMTRPLFKNIAEAETLFHLRQPLYVQYADEIIAVDERTEEEVSHEIINRITG